MHFSSVARMRTRSVPKALRTTFPRTPLTASSTLSLIGCEKLKLIPGISRNDARMSSISRSLVSPGRHWSLGLRRANTLAMFMPSLSSPSSGRPCSAGVLVTSGNSMILRRTSISTSWPLVSEMLGGISTKMYRSPSSSSGRNSVPTREPTAAVAPSSPSPSSTGPSRARRLKLSSTR